MRLARDLGDSECGVLALRAYHFLFKMADEALPLSFGTPSDARNRLPECRHSGTWVHNNDIQVRLRSRNTGPGLLEDRCLRLPT